MTIMTSTARCTSSAAEAELDARAEPAARRAAVLLRARSKQDRSMHCGSNYIYLKNSRRRKLMRFQVRSIVVLLSALAPLSPQAATIARNGQTACRIVLTTDATTAEQTAARELAAHLGKAAGARFGVGTEVEAVGHASCIYVGPTNFARSKGLAPDRLGAEEWIMRTVGDDLVLIGGRPRGTLYAVYRFLEDVVGVHWWNPREESVPHRPTLVVADLDRRGKPVLRYRDIYMLYGSDGGRFAARNRLNRDGDARISKDYGGGMDYGPPYHVHTFYLYCPPKTYFETHPKWFSLINGKRSADRTQLCLTNQEVRDFFVKKLKAYIESARKGAKDEGVPAPDVFDISQNDWGGMCQCEECQAIAKSEGSEAGPLFDFVNHLADAIKDEYPGVYIDTLAYTMTQKAPKTIRPRDNVIVRLCDTGSNFTKPITHEANTRFREHLLSWARIAKNLRIWDYAVTYGQVGNLPMPTAHTFPADYQFYAEHNVEGVFTEHEYPVLADLRDFKVWMMMKMLEDPYRDYDALVRTFTDGFYGPAGKHIREYLAALERAADEKPAHISMGNNPQKYRYLDFALVRAAHAIFDRAEAAVAEEPILLRRVRHARLSLDRATTLRFRYLTRQWAALGNEPETTPLNRQAIGKRAKATWYSQADLSLPPNQRAAAKKKADGEIDPQLARKAHVPLPAKFQDLAPGSVFDYLADMTRNWRGIVKVVPDPGAESGITNRLEFPAHVHADKHPVTRYQLPMPWGLYDQINRRGIGGNRIRPEDVPGRGYHWYKMGSFKITPSTYLYFFWSWIIQADIDDAIDPQNPDGKLDIWARIKFEGPAFPHGNAGEKDAICVERVVLAKSGGK